VPVSSRKKCWPAPAGQPDPPCHPGAAAAPCRGQKAQRRHRHPRSRSKSNLSPRNPLLLAPTGPGASIPEDQPRPGAISWICFRRKAFILAVIPPQCEGRRSMTDVSPKTRQFAVSRAAHRAAQNVSEGPSWRSNRGRIRRGAGAHCRSTGYMSVVPVWWPAEAPPVFPMA